MNLEPRTPIPNFTPEPLPGEGGAPVLPSAPKRSPYERAAANSKRDQEIFDFADKNTPLIPRRMEKLVQSINERMALSNKGGRPIRATRPANVAPTNPAKPEVPRERKKSRGEVIFGSGPVIHPAALKLGISNNEVNMRIRAHDALEAGKLNHLPEEEKQKIRDNHAEVMQATPAAAQSSQLSDKDALEAAAAKEKHDLTTVAVTKKFNQMAKSMPDAHPEEVRMATEASFGKTYRNLGLAIAAKSKKHYEENNPGRSWGTSAFATNPKGYAERRAPHLIDEVYNHPAVTHGSELKQLTDNLLRSEGGTAANPGPRWEGIQKYNAAQQAIGTGKQVEAGEDIVDEPTAPGSKRVVNRTTPEEREVARSITYPHYRSQNRDLGAVGIDVNQALKSSSAHQKPFDYMKNQMGIEDPHEHVRTILSNVNSSPMYKANLMSKNGREALPLVNRRVPTETKSQLPEESPSEGYVLAYAKSPFEAFKREDAPTGAPAKSEVNRNVDSVELDQAVSRDARRGSRKAKLGAEFGGGSAK